MSKIKKIAVFFIIGSLFFFSLSFYSFSIVNSLVINSKGTVHNSFIDDYDISNSNINDLDSVLMDIEKKITSQEITLLINNKEYKYTIRELGVEINKNELKQEIIDHENTLDYWDLYNNYSNNNFDKINYSYKYVINDSKLDSFFEHLKKRFNVSAKEGHLEMQEEHILKYVGEVTGNSINIEESKKSVKDYFENNNQNNTIDITVDKTNVDNSLKMINTKISSFTTTFDDTVDRKYNLIAGAKLLDGKIIGPHEEFSFFENAGPYTGINGYVYYLGVMGNGVCQVATTLYNAELLAGLTTTERYNHGKKSVYVDGGLDATVAVTGGGYITDFKFRNDYDYPVYISAFVEGDKLTIEMWSNENVKDGKEYKTESVRIGYGSYIAYRHIYKDGNLIETENLGHSYYYSE